MDLFAASESREHLKTIITVLLETETNYEQGKRRLIIENTKDRSRNGKLKEHHL